MSITANTTLPQNIIAEQISEKEGKVHLSKKLTVIQLSTENETLTAFDSSNSGTIFFSEAIPNSLIAGTISGGTTKYFTNFIGSSGVFSAISISSIYEHIRGYVNRDFSDNADVNWNAYLSTTAGQAGLIRRKIDGVGLTGVRVIIFNRSDYGDRIKPSSFIAHVNSSASAYKYGVELDNSNANDSGFWMGMTSNPGLVGSTQNGVSGSVLTGFSVYLRVKPGNSSSPIQTLFSRKSGDSSQSAMGNAIVDKQYMNLNPLSAHATVSEPYIYNNTTNAYEYTINVQLNYKIKTVNGSQVVSNSSLYVVGDIYTLVGGDGTASVRITQVTVLVGVQIINYTIQNYGVANYTIGYYSTNAPAGKGPLTVQVTSVEAVPVANQSISASSSAVITICNLKHGMMRWGVSSNQEEVLLFTTTQAVPVTNSGFATLSGWYTSAGSAYSSSYSGTTANVVSYKNSANTENLTGNRLIISGLTSGISSDYIFQKLVLSAGLSGLILSFDMTTTGTTHTGQLLKTLIQKDSGPSADRTSICSFSDSYLPGYSQWPYKSTIQKNIDLLYNAPAFEFTPTAVWIGFSIDNSAAIAYDREFHIQNVKVSCIPSTLYDGQSGSITAWFNSIPNSTNYLTLFARKKNLEIFPNKKIYFTLHQQ